MDVQQVLTEGYASELDDDWADAGRELEDEDWADEGRELEDEDI
jgi:hypothetical protein